MKLPSYFRLAVPAYVLLLLVAAALGSNNQGLLRRQAQLRDEKGQLLTAIADTRRQAAHVNGPTAIANWAALQGMVPVPEALNSVLVAPDEVALSPLPTPSLEIRTVWR